LEFTAEVFGNTLRFAAGDALFSPSGIDRGTQAMLSACKNMLYPGCRVMDLGCGYGAVGVSVSHIVGAQNVVMADIDPVAVEFAKQNALKNGADGAKILVSDGFSSVDAAAFDVILVNPPYQTDFAVARGFIRKGFNRLSVGGWLFMVTKRREWYKNKIISTFGGVNIQEIDGYFVFSAQKKGARYAGVKPRKNPRAAEREG